MSDDYNPKKIFEYSLNAANAKEEYEKYDKAIDSFLANSTISTTAGIKFKIEENQLLIIENTQAFSITPVGYLLSDKPSLISRITPKEKGVIKWVDTEYNYVTLSTPGYSFFIKFGQDKKPKQ